jgi:hypothetical protein
VTCAGLLLMLSATLVAVFADQRGWLIHDRLALHCLTYGAGLAGIGLAVTGVGSALLRRARMQ